ncbi:MAG: transposase [Algisphaera sp.]
MQSNLTDPDSRGMYKRGAFTQGYNAQATVDAEGSMLLLGISIVQSSSDMGQLVSGVTSVDPSLGPITSVLADAGYAKASEIEDLEAMGIEAFVAVCANDRRELDYRPLPSVEQIAAKEASRKRRARELKNPTLVAMKAKLETDEGRKVYRLRQQTVEPIFGTVKFVLGFREFRMRGLTGVETEWKLVGLACNIRRLATLTKLKKTA